MRLGASSGSGTALVHAASLLRLLRSDRPDRAAAFHPPSLSRRRPPSRPFASRTSSPVVAPRPRRRLPRVVVRPASHTPPPASPAAHTPRAMPFGYDVLAAQDAGTTSAIIAHYERSPAFLALAKAEGDSIMRRDAEDAAKLAQGIALAKEKGVLDPDFVPEAYVPIDVLGKSPGEVADEILGTVRAGAPAAGGGVVVLCGLSGTGKGTTVATLQEKLATEDGKEVVCWSNGNVFRSVTLLAVTWCERQEGIDGFDPARALTKDNLAAFVGMLEFGKVRRSRGAGARRTDARAWRRPTAAASRRETPPQRDDAGGLAHTLTRAAQWMRAIALS